MFVCSTGWFGYPLPMDRIAPAIPSVAAPLDPDGGPAAAVAMMTTDKVLRPRWPPADNYGGVFTVGGVAKGAAMFGAQYGHHAGRVTTDAEVDPSTATTCCETPSGLVQLPTVDGAESTNDTVLLFGPRGGGRGTQ
ncbi:MAG: hypothetical protein Ct9H300mP12_00670 [Acidimicrobiales bacterium]|nr:MAG: hypothetical protein Ct9H300mP12_00670 [Acidimicrobiales bacterium]